MVGFEVAALVVLHRLGAQPWLQVEPDLHTWLAVVGAEDAVVVALRYVALGAAWWLVLSTGLYVLARLVRLPAAVRAVGWATLPAVRRIADRAVAVTIASSVVAGAPVAAVAAPAPAVAEVAVVPGLDPGSLPPPEDVVPEDVAGQDVVPDDVAPQDVVPDEAGAPPPDRRDGAADLTVPAVAPPPARGAVSAAPLADGPGAAEPEPRGPAAATTEAAVPESAAPPAPSPGSAPRGDRAGPSATEPTAPQGASASVDASTVPPATAPTSHVVAPGEHLWGVAAARLATLRPDGSTPGDAEIARYWRRVVAANVARLRSGDPDLVFPGETVLLPPLGDDAS